MKKKPQLTLYSLINAFSNSFVSELLKLGWECRAGWEELDGAGASSSSYSAENSIQYAQTNSKKQLGDLCLPSAT